MVNQRGSVLAGAIALSIVMSMTAGSLLIVASNSRNDEDMAFRRAGCYLDAESGLMMGLSWLRNHPNFLDRAALIHDNQGWTPSFKVLITDQTFDNGSQVTVTVIDNAVGKTVVSRADFGAESIQFSWDVDVEAGGNTAAPILKLTNWRSP